MRANIDGDILVYSIGFAGDLRYYEIDNKIFQYKKDATKYCLFHEIDQGEVQLKLFPGSLHNTLRTLNTVIEKIKFHSKCDEYKVYLTGKGNYREKLAVTNKYKGNRDGTLKPFYYDEIRAYLVNIHNAIIVDGMEADDALGLAQSEKTVLCSKDKDLDTIPGLHLNWDKLDRGIYTVTEDEANAFFYKQVLMGDSTDNIKSIHGLGPKTADAMLCECVDEEERFSVCMCAYLEKASYERLIENMYLLFIQGANHLAILGEGYEKAWTDS